MEYIDLGPEASWVKIGYDGDNGSVVLEVPGTPDRSFVCASNLGRRKSSHMA